MVLLSAAVVAITGTTDEFAAWAWALHHNVLSWYIRPSLYPAVLLLSLQAGIDPHHRRER
jgi:hypothetical protein